MKKLISMILALVVMASAAACGTQSESAPSQEGSAAPSSTAPSESASSCGADNAPAGELTLPLTEEPVTLTYYMPIDRTKAAPVLTDYSEVAAYQELEKLTNVKIQFIHPAMGQEAEQFNIMLASQDYPDLIWYNWIAFPGGPQKAIDDGVILPLNDLIDQNCPNIREKVTGNPEIAKTILTDEGNFYYFPYIHWNQLVKAGWSFLVRNDWLQDMDMELPETIGEWDVMLAAFKEAGDLNGNGVDDEWPLTSMVTERDILRWLANAFGTDYDFYHVDGTVHYGPLDDAFKDYLTKMADWYAKGYIDPEFSSQDLNTYEAKIANGQAAVFLSGLDFGRYLISLGDEAMTGLKYPVLEKGSLPIYNNGTLQGGQGAGIGISTACENKELAAKWVDFHYAEQGHMLLNFGIEGESYNMVNNQPEFTEEILHNPEGLSVELALVKYGMGGISEAFFHDPLVRYARFGTFPVQRETIERTQTIDLSYKLPPITPTSEESSEYANIMSEVNTYLLESWAKFINGSLSVETDYDNFIATMESLGIERAVELRQAALDRYMQR